MIKSLVAKKLLAIALGTAASMIVPAGVLALPGYKLVSSKIGPVIVNTLADKIAD